MGENQTETEIFLSKSKKLATEIIYFRNEMSSDDQNEAYKTERNIKEYQMAFNKHFGSVDHAEQPLLLYPYSLAVLGPEEHRDFWQLTQKEEFIEGRHRKHK